MEGQPRHPTKLEEELRRWGVGLVMLAVAALVRYLDGPLWVIVGLGCIGVILVLRGYFPYWFRLEFWTDERVALALITIWPLSTVSAIYAAETYVQPITFVLTYPLVPNHDSLSRPFVGVSASLSEEPRSQKGAEADDPRIQFTSSPLWTDDRKATVREQIHSFDQFVSKGDILKPPEVLPLLNIVEGRQVVSIFVAPANPPFDQRQIPMSTKALTPYWIRERYANYVFDTILGVYERPGTDLVLDSQIYSEYFAASSLNRAPSLDAKRLNGWLPALWEIRKEHGQDFTDRVLRYSLKAPVVYSNDLNKRVRERLQSGVLVVKNDFSEFIEVNKILERHGLLR